jgi:hypothetical protein
MSRDRSLKLLATSAPSTPPAAEDEDDLPPGEILETLRDLKERGLLAPEMLKAVEEAAAEMGLKLG